MSETSIENLHVLIEGRVQGVNFRATTQSQAHTLGLTGWVRNRADGRVEAHFFGSRQALEQILQWCRQGPALANVTNVHPTWNLDAEPPPRFAVRG